MIEQKVIVYTITVLETVAISLQQGRSYTVVGVWCIELANKETAQWTVWMELNYSSQYRWKT